MNIFNIFNNCLDCSRSGLFTKLDQDGYCPACAQKRAIRAKAEAERLAKKKEREEYLNWLKQPPAYIPKKTSSPTAHNAFIFNLDYIRRCRKEFIAFDLETTGFSPLGDRIIEISAVRFRDFAPTDSFSTLVNPLCHIPESASKVNHIYDADVATSPKESEAVKQFCNFIGEDALKGNVVMVAHNALFDIKFLLHAFSRCYVEADISYQDTLHMSRQANLGTENNKLGTLAKYFNIPQEAAHRAEDDARVCGEIFIALLQSKEKEHLSKLDSLSPNELELCHWLKNIVEEADMNTELMTFHSKTYLYFRCLSEVARFKPKAKKPYVLIPRSVSIPDEMITAEASKSEGDQWIRVFYQKPAELIPLKQHFLDTYQIAFHRAEEYIGDSQKTMQRVAQDLDLQICL